MEKQSEMVDALEKLYQQHIELLRTTDEYTKIYEPVPKIRALMGEVLNSFSEEE